MLEMYFFSLCCFSTSYLPMTNYFNCYFYFTIAFLFLLIIVYESVVYISRHNYTFSFYLLKYFSVE